MGQTTSTKTEHTKSRHLPRWRLFACVLVLWFILDRITKAYFEHVYTLGQSSVTDYVLFRFTLVHNSGAAWGIFGDATFALGVVALVMCAVLTVVFALMKPVATPLQTLGFALVVAGGLGNAIDRFFQSYVIDFIEFTFMDFPVFNVADIGVTCGLVLVLGGLLLSMRNDAGGETACTGTAGAAGAAGAGTDKDANSAAEACTDRASEQRTDTHEAAL